MPLLRGLSRKDGAEIFELVQGFAKSQALHAIVELRLLQHLMDGPATNETLAHHCSLPKASMQLLTQAGAAMGLLQLRRDERIGLTRKGAALTGVPGLEQMILHHRALYRDLENPVAFLRGNTTPELATFWPYVFGATGEIDPTVSRAYSRLMADSQALVAADTLDAVSLRGVSRLLDIGGGSGVFLAEVARRHPRIALDLFDLPTVSEAARERLGDLGLADRVVVHGGSFRTDPLPRGADAVALIRVLYDHEDATVRALLESIFETLPPGGRLIISEPMSGGARPDPVTDVYFALYTRAMGTGRTRSQDAISELCREAGFTTIKTPRPFRSYVTSVVTAVKPG